MKLFIVYIILIIVFFDEGKSCPLILDNNTTLPSTALEYIPQNFDVISYNAMIDFSGNKISDKIIRSANNRVTLKWVNTNPNAKFYFHLQSLTVDSILNESNIKVQFQKDTTPTGEAIYNIDRNKLPNDSNVILIYYHGKMTAEKGSQVWGGVSFTDNTLYALGVGFRNDYVSTTRHWLPCYDHPSDKALFKYNFKIDDSLTIVSNGLLISETTDKIKSMIWESKYPMASYLATFALGKYVKIDFTKDSIPIYVYTQKKDSLATAYNFARVSEMVSYFSNTFTPYPFEKVGYVNTELGSMESQSMINYANSLNQNALNNKTNINETAAHELAHQWFGDMLSPFDFRDAWLNESFATFSESLWIEKSLGKKQYLNNQKNKMNNYINTVFYQDGPISLYNFDRNRCKSNYPTTIYQKGAVVLGMLRYMMGDSSYFESMKDYLYSYKYKNVTTLDLLKILKLHTKINMDSFFENWIFRNEIPIFKVNFKQNKDSMYIEDYLSNDTVMPFKSQIPLEFNFTYQNGDIQTQVFMFESNKNYKVNVPPNFVSLQYNGAKEVVSLARVVSITGIEEDTKIQAKISILENPIKDKLKIKYNFSNGKAKISIYSLNGNTLLTKDILSNGSENLIELDFHNFSSGAYFVSILQDGKEETIEFIKE